MVEIPDGAKITQLDLVFFIFCVQGVFAQYLAGNWLVNGVRPIHLLVRSSHIVKALFGNSEILNLRSYSVLTRMIFRDLVK